MEPLGNDRLRILSCITSEAAYLPNSSAIPEPKTCQSTCRNTICEENCKYKRKENSPLKITHSVHISGLSSICAMAPSVQTTLGRDLNFQLPTIAPLPPLPSTPSSDITTLAAMIEDIRPVHAPPGDPSLFFCKFTDTTLLGYNTTGITCAT